MAPDGILGPYRQKEGSFYTVREIWSPAYIDMDTLPAGFDGTIPIANRYDFTNLNQCSFAWKLVDFPFTGQDTGNVVAASGAVPATSIAPHSQGNLVLPCPPDGGITKGSCCRPGIPTARKFIPGPG